MSTTVEPKLTPREAIPEYMGPVLAIVEGMDHHKHVNANVARAIGTLAMNAHQALDQADADHGVRQNPSDTEYWEAEALCFGIAAMATLAAGEGQSMGPGPDRFQAFQAMQTYARMIREHWFAGA